MTRPSRNRERALLKKLLPWLSQEYGEELTWLGCPEDTKYQSACPAARNARNPLDAELAGPTLRIAVEHTSVESLPGQRQEQAALKELAGDIRRIRHLVPCNNEIWVSVSCDQPVNRRLIRGVTHHFIEKLCQALRFDA